MACRVALGVLPAQQEVDFKKAFNAVCLPFNWADIEPEEESFQWQEYDRMVSWAASLGMPVIGGPLVNFPGAACRIGCGARKPTLAACAAT